VKTMEKRLDTEPALRGALEEVLSEFGYSTADAPGC